MDDEFNDELDFDDDFQIQDNYKYDEDSSFDNFSSNYDYLDDVNDEFIDRNIYYDNYDYNDNYDDDYDDSNSKKNDYRKKIFTITALILVILCISFLIFTLFFKNTKNTKTNSKKEDEIVVKQKKIDYNVIFEKTKRAALKYYDEERIKQTNGDVSLNTLKMLELIDSIDDNINLDSSVVKISEQDDNIYKLDIILKNKNTSEIKNRKYSFKHSESCNETYLCDLDLTTNDKKESNSTQEDISDENKNNKEYLYEYIRNEKQISNWSSWSNLSEVSCDTNEIVCSSDDCLKEIKISSSNVRINSSNKVYISKRLAFKTNGKIIGQACKNYDYVKIDNQYYRTELNSNYKDVGLLKKDTPGNFNNWIYKGRINVKTPPNDTINTRYVYVEADYSQCGATCSDRPNYYYDKYVFSKKLYAITTPENDCNNLIQKGMPYYSILEQKISVSRLEDNYKKVCYKRERTRTIKNNKISKWSIYNDQNLLNNNYIYSGNKKEK